MKKIYLILCISILCSCASFGVYFNTFLNAKKYYAEAKLAKEKNDNKLNSNIKKTFDKSITRCAYILKEYPDSKYADDALLLMGQSYFEYEKYLKALRKFQEFEKFYFKSPLFPSAKLYLLKTYLKLKKLDKAKNHFFDIKNSDNFLSVRVLAILEFSEYYLQRKNFQKAKELLKSITEMKVSDDAHQNTLYQIAQIEFQNKEYENALNSFKKALSYKTSKRTKLDITFYVGKTYLKLDQYESGLRLFEKLKKDESDTEKIKEIALQIGICNAHLGEIKDAFLQFETLVNENTGKQIAEETNYYWGEIYFFVLKDYQKAIEKFQNISDLNEEISERAFGKKKIANLFLEEQNQRKSNKILELAETQLKIAEYYILDMAQPDSAIAYYDKILNNPSLFANKLDSLNQKLNTLKTENPKSEKIIIDTLASILDSISIKVETDSLKIQTSKNSLAVKDSIIQMTETLKNNLLDYQEKIYPKALLIKAWTLFSEKKDTTSVKNIVKELEQDYPDSKYCFATQRMLQHQPIQLITKYEFEAKSFFEKSMEYFNDNITAEKSISYLDTIITTYAESSVFPEALYAKADLLIREKSDLSQAEPYLEKLVQDYPQHELTQYSTDFFDGKNFIIEAPNSDSISTKDTILSVLPDSIVIEDIDVETDSLEKTEKEVATSDTLAVFPEQAETHTVVKGECLWFIAEYPKIYNNPYKWTKIYQANTDKIKDPDLIYPGQVFRILRD